MPKENIVIGVHDPVPPQGLVTVRLVDPDRPWRVRKEVKGENLLTNWWLSGGNSGFRNGNVGGSDTFTQNRVGFAPNAGCTTAGYTRYNEESKLGGHQGVWPGAAGNYINTFWASNQNVTPDAAKAHIPTNDIEGDLTGYACTDLGYGLSADHTQRGTVVFTDSFRTWDKSRTVMEWSTTQGNGVWRSLGYGNVNSRSTGSKCAPAPFYYGKDAYRDVRMPDFMSDFPTYGRNVFSFAGRIESGGWDPAGTYFYWAGSNAVGCQNITDYTAVYAATAITTGTGRVTVAHDGTDLWVARGKSVYRVDAANPNSIINTYDLSANITESDIRDITSDGTSLYLLTSTHVHVATAASGAWASSWTHGQTSTGVMEGNVEYDYAMGHLWISFDPNYVSSTSSGANPWNSNGSGSRIGTEGDNFRVRAFAVGGGTQLNYAFKPGWWVPSYQDDMKTGFTGLDPQGWVGFTAQIHDGNISPIYTYAYGPGMASHLLLPADITKTSSDSLQVIYDFDYS